MPTIFETKEQLVVDCPLLLFQCYLTDGSVHNWSSQAVTVSGVAYDARILKHNVFEMQASSDQGIDAIPKISFDLANADSHFSEIERQVGFKGARLTVSFLFFDLKNNAPRSETAVLFKGITNSPELITESVFRLNAINRLSMQRVVLPSVRIQRRCSWSFPQTLPQRIEAVNGGERGRFSRFYPCGYSADLPEGFGNLNGGVPFESCAFTRSECEQRGMFRLDSQGRTTARFSGIEFVPPTITVRSAGEKSNHLSPVSVNESRYNDFVPLLYGTAWFAPEIVFARNDGNLTRMEVLLGLGEIQAIHKVLVNNIDIPKGQAGINMTGTGWFNVVSYGSRNGGFNPDFTDAASQPLGDPYGSMAFLSVVVPNRINDGQSLPSIQVLADGLKVNQYDADGEFVSYQWSNNPCWIILDILLRNGWTTEEMDLSTFALAAAYCDEQISTIALNGSATTVARFQCNLVLQNRRTASDVLRGVRTSSRLYLTFGFNGLLQLKVENTVSLQSPIKPSNSNATIVLNEGWPAYEFGDGTNNTSGILRNKDGSSTVRLSSRSASDTPNRFSVEFQDSFNDYQQDSFSIADSEDVEKTGQEVSVTLNALGLPNYDQATRIAKFTLGKSIQGNLFLEFQTSVKAVGLQPGDIIAFTYLKEGLERTPFRVLKIAPGFNYRTVVITAQVHDDSWYTDDEGQGQSGGRREAGYGIGVPRPLGGTILDENSDLQFVAAETFHESQDGVTSVFVNVDFASPGILVAGAPQIPFVSLAPKIDNTGGSLPGAQIFYYAVSCLDADGNESPLSFVVPAALPAESTHNQVILEDLGFPASAKSFRVYRGPNSLELTLIYQADSLSTNFLDPGYTEQAILPPDPNYDHANFYWRLEAQSEVNATSHSDFTIGNEELRMMENEYAGMTVRIVRGKGAPQERIVSANSTTVLTLSKPWMITPDPTSVFVISQSSYQFGATTQGNRVQFQIPNRPGAYIQICGRSANSHDVECPYEISPVTRWKIGGAGIKTVDTDIPAVPVFGLGMSAANNGTLEIGAIGFADLTNTSSISAGTFVFHSYNELNGPSPIALASDLSLDEDTVQLNQAFGGESGNTLQIEKELLQVSDISADRFQIQVLRSILGTEATSHSAGTAVYLLSAKTTIVPFIRNFFGTPASGSWSYSVPLPNSRLAAAELFVTNSQGNSPTAVRSLTNTIDSGLRTGTGGQYTFQIAGFLSIQSSAAPDVVLDDDHVIRDIFAFVNVAPSATPLQINLNLNDVLLCTLTFDAGSVVSNSVDGRFLPVLRATDRLSIDIFAVGDTIPGSDLTIIIRV